MRSAFVGETGLQLLGRLAIDGLQALRAQMHALGAATHHHRSHRDIRVEHAIGVALRETYIVTKLRTFAAAFTLCHLIHLYAK
jgi:hypothetical protein